MRASRLVQLLLLLQTAGKMTAGRLATELEVSVRTIYRDVEALGSAGVPIYAESGPGGGIRLVDGYRTRLTGLTAEEAEALALSGLPGAASELGLGTVLAAAQLKVDAALPPELRSRAVRMRERFHLDAPGWFAREEPVPHLAALSRAVWDQQRIAIRYEKRDGEVRRTLDPLGLVLKAGVWYLVALSGRSRELRTFRVSRVSAVRELGEPASRPDGFDLAAQWAESSQTFLTSWPSIEVTARVQARSLWALRGALGEADPGAVAVPDADGWVDVVLRYESVPIAVHELLRLGADVEVLAPLEAREAMATTASAMVQRYAEVS